MNADKGGWMMQGDRFDDLRRRYPNVEAIRVYRRLSADSALFPGNPPCLKR
jgi:hypothetical protein